MPRDVDQARILQQRRQSQSTAAAASQAAQRRAQEQQRYYQQQNNARRQAEQRARQAQVTAQAQAQKRASEQATRIANQQRRDRLQARSESVRKGRMARATARHTVKAGDTPESISAQYGTTPQAVASMVKRLRPGQRLDIPTAQFTGAQAGEEPTGGGGLITPGLISPATGGGPFSQVLARLGFGAMPTIANALARFGQRAGEGTLQTPYYDPAQQGFTAAGEGLAEGVQELQESREYLMATGQDVPRANLAQYNEARRPPGGIHEQMAASVDQAKLDQGLFMHTMRYTGQALSYAWKAMTSGEDPNWRRFISDSDGNINMFITANDTWDTGPMKNQFSQDMWSKIEELGFVMVEEDLWMIPDVLDAGYGMGGYEFPGYGGGFGAGGDYEYLSRGGVARRKKGGGVSTGERYRVFPEGVSPSHWRI